MKGGTTQGAVVVGYSMKGGSAERAGRFGAQGIGLKVHPQERMWHPHPIRRHGRRSARDGGLQQDRQVRVMWFFLGCTNGGGVESVDWALALLPCGGCPQHFEPGVLRTFCGACLLLGDGVSLAKHATL